MPFHSRSIDTSTRKDDGDLERELQSIYRDEKGSLRDMSHFEYRRKRRRSHTLLYLFLVLVTFVVGAGVGGFFFFRNQDRFTGEGVKVTVTAPEQVTSGETIRYVVRYANNEPLVLGNVELTLRYPRGFTLKEAHPAPTNTSGTSGGTWAIGTLPRGREGAVELLGTLVGSLNSQANLQALLSYKPANFNAEFQEIGSATTTVASSLLNLVVDGSERSLPDAETLYTITYENTADDALLNAEVRVVLADDFTITGTKPDRAGSLAQWDFGTIEKKKKGTIEIRGKYAKEAAGERKVSAAIGLGRGDAFLLQKDDVFVTNIVKGDVLASLAVNGSNAGVPVQFGDTLRYTITVKNNADTPMENVTVRLLVASPAVDWATLDDAAHGVRDGSTLSWSKSLVRDLRLLDPGEEVTINTAVRLKRGKEGLNLEDLVIESRAEITVAKAGKLPAPIVVSSNTIVNQVNTDMALENEARYFADDGTTIGDGPLPPKVGMTTTYRVRWTLTNTLHEVFNVKASTLLPLDTQFGAIGRVSQGTLLYNPDTREVSWTLQRLPTTIPQATAEFSVTITPAKEAVGKILPLTGDVQVQARDKVTTGLMTLKKSGLNTALDDDEFGRGKGVVVE
ncbi:DUF11 domain-containing protein [Candidatus Uhrbacteria bacterium]|nr:DUF11 domain-containing protein [Candidatus Uhrbacteria bacterium]